MQITDVRVRKVAKEGKLKAVVSITIDDEFVVHDIKVIEGEKGMFIAMPSKRYNFAAWNGLTVCYLNIRPCKPSSFFRLSRPSEYHWDVYASWGYP